MEATLVKPSTMQGSGYPAPLANFAVFRIEDVLHGKAGAGRADEVAAPAADARDVYSSTDCPSGHKPESLPECAL